MKPHRKWTAEEIAVLRKRVSSKSAWADVGRAIGRDAEMCRKKALSLGIYARTPQPAWSADEDAIVRAMLAEGATHSAIGARLGRSENSITTRLSKLRVRARDATRTDRTTRPCMTCRRPFPSEGAHNRMCDNCRTAARESSYDMSLAGARFRA